MPLLNLMRVLGTSLGVASATSVLTWQLGTVAGSHTGIPVTGGPLLRAVASTLTMLAIMAVVAGAVSLVRASGDGARPDGTRARRGT